MVNGKSFIDQEKCIKCGKCKSVCPYDAIAKKERPCQKACGVNAITSDKYGRAFIDNDKFKADFELAKKYYALGAELGNDICKDRLKDYDKRIKKTQRLIARSILEDPKTGKLMEDEDIEALLDWFRDKFKAK